MNAFDDFEFCQMLGEISQQVEDLRFENMTIRFAMPDGRLTISLKFPKVKTLEISNCNVIQPVDYCGPVLVGFPQRFPALERLICKTSTIPNLFTYELPDLITLGRLKYLQIDDDEDLHPLTENLSTLKLKIVCIKYCQLGRKEESGFFNDENNNDGGWSTGSKFNFEKIKQKRFPKWFHKCFLCIRKN